MKAMILAAGLGSRMRPLTDSTPKPLLQVQGKPLLEHLIFRLKEAGCNEIIINVSYLADKIETFLAAKKTWGVKLTLSNEPFPLETAGGIVKALPLLGRQPFLLINSDVWIDFPFDRLVADAGAMDSASPFAHLVMVGNPDHNQDGDFKLPIGKASNAVKLSLQEGEALTYSGVGIYHPGLFENLAPGKQALGPLLKTWIGEGKITGEKFSGYWLDVGTPGRLQQLDEFLVEGGEN